MHNKNIIYLQCINIEFIIKVFHVKDPTKLNFMVDMVCFGMTVDCKI